MSNTDKKGLSASDICRIIKQCRGAGVAKVTIAGVSIEFHPQRNEDAQIFQITPENMQVTSLMPANPELMDEAELAQLMIDDPFAYEKVQMSADIERNRSLNAKA